MLTVWGISSRPSWWENLVLRPMLPPLSLRPLKPMNFSRYQSIALISLSRVWYVSADCVLKIEILLGLIVVVFFIFMTFSGACRKNRCSCIFLAFRLIVARNIFINFSVAVKLLEISSGWRHSLTLLT